VRANDPDPVVRWQSISKWYAEFSQDEGWEFLAPMVELTIQISTASFASRLYPSTSHQRLCVHLTPDDDPDAPFFSCCTRPDGLFEFGRHLSTGGRDGLIVCDGANAFPQFELFALALTLSLDPGN
jgi:hypothetical protein